MNPTPLAYYRTSTDHSLLFWGEGPLLKCYVGSALSQLDAFIARNSNRYLVSFLTYDLKNEIENLQSDSEDLMGLPDLMCWNPAYVVELKVGQKPTYLQGQETEQTNSFVQDWLDGLVQISGKLPFISFNPQISKTDYLETVQKLQHEIQLGNTYELNFCQNFYAENVPDFDSKLLIQKQFELTKAPFSAYIQLDEFEIYCGSPERFLQKSSNRLSSEPIKGTIRRGISIEEDQQLKHTLENDPKERAENIMIVDLVRNDLARIATKNSVTVDELCGIHTFETVHHMISTVSCEIVPDIPFSAILKATFPMGSMTGAPKISSMDLIEKHESFKRGIYSGSIGYFKPNGDFDFNVVIRSFLRNKAKATMSCAVGGAITIQSDPAKEYEECLVKVKKMVQLFGDEQGF